MKTLETIEQAFSFFKKSYNRKMGGTQTVVLPNGESKFFDDREYYSGRGAKYNSSIQHDEIGEVKVSQKEYSEFLKMLKDREERRATNLRKAAEKADRIEKAKSAGVYSIAREEYGNFIELSDDETYSNSFDAERLAKTLDIRVEDAELLNSAGKTYVFAKQISTGKIIELFHASLLSNDLNISFEYVSEERVAEFDHEEWASAPYAGVVGQTDKKNHFVC